MHPLFHRPSRDPACWRAVAAAPAAALLIAAAAAFPAVAGPLRGQCPAAEMTPELSATEAACNRDADCSRIADQYASCARVKAWLAAVAPADGKAISAFDVQRGLARARNPFLSAAEAHVRHEACLGANFSLQACRDYLGVGPIDDRGRAPGGPPVVPPARPTGGGFAASLFQQSMAQAANDPDASARAAAEAQSRQQQIDQVAANDRRRQAAIVSGAIGSFTQTLPGAGGVSRAGPGGGLLNTLNNLQQMGAATAAAADSAGGGAGNGSTGPAGAAPAGPAVALGPARYSGSCPEVQLQVQQEIEAINGRRPPRPDTVQSLQTALYVLGRALAELSGPACAGDAEASRLVAQLYRTQDGAMADCRAIASNTALCAPQRNW